MDRHHLRGTLLLAREGINGTIAGTRKAIDELLAWFKLDDRFDGLSYKLSGDIEFPFHRAKVKLKSEIVTMGMENIDPRHAAGTYVKPSDWNQLIEDPEVTVIDTRNDYEVRIGTFKNAVNPVTTAFREFPEYVRSYLDPKKNKKVAMFCTGGIRCEKSTAYLKGLGFDNVYHLEGGILNYLKVVKKDESLWLGECFVFDNRVSVDHDLEPGKYRQCHACRMPITEEDMHNGDYEEGISCPHCLQKQSEQQRLRFREREKQVQLARQRGEEHIGVDAAKSQKAHKQSKLSIKQQQQNQQ